MMGSKHSSESNMKNHGKSEVGAPKDCEASIHNFSEETNVDQVHRPNYREREHWDRPVEFLFACIGYAVGLGNVWRFPYLCYKNGGGAFMVPYFVCLLTGGIPIFFMEVAVGQYMGEGGITSWNICPIFKGIGYGSCVIVLFCNMYYIVIMAWSLHYLFASFTWELPWTTCNNWWNTPACVDFQGELTANRTNQTQTVDWQNMTNSSGNNVTMVTTKVILATKDAVSEYWEHRVLHMSGSIEEVGNIQWELALTLLLAWVITYFCIWKGIRSSGKVVYFTATFPYVMLTVLFIRGVTLPGAGDGILYFLRPDFSKLLVAQVWIDAGTQIFYSYAVAIGCMIALGSYNKFHHNFMKDCIIISVINSGTSMYAGFVIFSVLGFMAHQQNIDISQVAESGPGLAFIAYPKAVAQMPGASIWSVFFFIMILLLGLDSQFVTVEGFITAVVDTFPTYLRVGYRREFFIATVALFCYSIGLFMVTNGGIYVFQVFDYFAVSGFVLLWFCFFECVAIAWVYGGKRLYDNIEMMVGYRINPWLRICWSVLSPLLTMGIMIFTLATYEPLTYNRVYMYPIWAQALGWFLTLSSTLFIPIMFFHKLFSYPGTLKKKWQSATTPILKKHQIVKGKYGLGSSIQPEGTTEYVAHPSSYSYETLNYNM